jgi:hypothetical protein
MSAGQLAAQLPDVSDDAERQRIQGQIQRLRARARTALQTIAVLLTVAVITMAIGRYM